MMLYGIQATKTRKIKTFVSCFLCGCGVGCFSSLESVEYMGVPDFCER